ncbi:MAG: HK97 gp10 family phage protein [Clostridia bacterium]|nr:HK97 gp10 family phage protein [Clostridia bacterium]
MKGLETVTKNLEDFSALIQKRIASAVQRAGESAAGKAREKAPTNSAGESGSSSISLKNSISAKLELSGGRLTSVVRASAPHAQYVEFGTGFPIGHAIYTTVQRRGVNKQGQPYKPYTIKGWIYPLTSAGGKVTFRVTQGMAPRPFMRPAMIAGREILEKKLRNIRK